MTDKYLYQKLKNEEISALDFLLQSDEKYDFLQWCRLHDVEPDLNSAGFYLDMSGCGDNYALEEEDSIVCYI